MVSMRCFIIQVARKTRPAGSTRSLAILPGGRTRGLGSIRSCATRPEVTTLVLGHSAGSALTTGSNNIDIGNVGVAGESNTIRIGTTQLAAYMSGISGKVVRGVALLWERTENWARLFLPSDSRKRSNRWTRRAKRFYRSSR